MRFSVDQYYYVAFTTSNDSYICKKHYKNKYQVSGKLAELESSPTKLIEPSFSILDSDNKRKGYYIIFSKYSAPNVLNIIKNKDDDKRNFAIPVTCMEYFAVIRCFRSHFIALKHQLIYLSARSFYLTIIKGIKEYAQCEIQANNITDEAINKQHTLSNFSKKKEIIDFLHEAIKVLAHYYVDMKKKEKVALEKEIMRKYNPSAVRACSSIPLAIRAFDSTEKINIASDAQEWESNTTTDYLVPQNSMNMNSDDLELYYIELDEVNEKENTEDRSILSTFSYTKAHDTSLYGLNSVDNIEEELHSISLEPHTQTLLPTIESTNNNTHYKAENRSSRRGASL